MNKKLVIVLIIVVIFGVGMGAYFYLKKAHFKKPEIKVENFNNCAKVGYPVMESYPCQCKTPDGKTFVEDIGNELEKQDLIRVINPRPNQTIESSLVVEGEARGYWFFEASFPVKIFDANNNLLGQTIAQAKSEWMTEDFIPFQATIEFSIPTTETGKLILERDNPSGLPENEDQLIVPILFKNFSASQEKIKIKAYFNNSNLDPEASCNKVFSVEREIPKTEAVARAALEELLKGVTEKEKSEGFFTSINSGVKIQKLTIENGIAKVDFDEQLEFQIGGSCRVSAIRAQITQTLKQFTIVKEVIISIDGRTEDILQP